MNNPLVDDEHAPKHIAAQRADFHVDTSRLFSTVRNFQEVTPYLFRGGQPGADGIAELAKGGIKTVLSLRTGENAVHAERLAVESTGMKFISMPMSYWWAPGADVTARVLDVIDDDANWPIFLHCAHGMDRTGLIAAMFRVSRQAWRVQDAYHEMNKYGHRRFRLRHFKWTLYQYARALNANSNGNQGAIDHV